MIDIIDIPPVRLHRKAPPPRPATPITVHDNEILDSEELILDPIRYGPKVDIGPAPVQRASEEAEEFVPFHAVEERPQLIGCLGGLQQEMRYPDLARRVGIQGRVFVEFVVDEEGIVTDLTVVKGIGGGCDEEAMRVLREARFTPGRQRTKPVRVKMFLSIAFRLR